MTATAKGRTRTFTEPETEVKPRTRIKGATFSTEPKRGMTLTIEQKN